MVDDFGGRGRGGVGCKGMGVIRIGLCCGFFSNLVVDLFQQVLGNDTLKVRVVHKASKKVLVLLHAVNEKSF